MYFVIAKTSGVKLGWVNSAYLGMSIQTNTGMNPLNLRDLGTATQALMLGQMEIGSNRFVYILNLWRRELELKKIRQQQANPLPQDTNSKSRVMELAAFDFGFDKPSDASMATPRQVKSSMCPQNEGHDMELAAFDFGFDKPSDTSLATPGQSQSSMCPQNEEQETNASSESGITFNIDAVRGRNAQYAHLLDAEREKLDDLDYRSTIFLRYYLILIEVLWHVAATSVGVLCANAAGSDMNARWVVIYTMLSAFQNNGTNLLVNGMISFAEDITIQVWAIVFMLAGNVCWPILLHYHIWLMWRFCKMMSKRSKASSNPTSRTQLN